MTDLNGNPWPDEVKRARKNAKRLADAEKTLRGREQAREFANMRTVQFGAREYVPVHGHREKGLLIRQRDCEAVVHVGIVPVRGEPGTFRQLDLLWPSGIESYAQRIKLTDWREHSLYDTVEIGPP